MRRWILSSTIFTQQTSAKSAATKHNIAREPKLLYTKGMRMLQLHRTIAYTVVFEDAAAGNRNTSIKIASINFQIKNPAGDTIFSFLPPTGVFTKDLSQTASAQSITQESILHEASPLKLTY